MSYVNHISEIKIVWYIKYKLQNTVWINYNEPKVIVTIKIKRMQLSLVLYLII